VLQRDLSRQIDQKKKKKNQNKDLSYDGETKVSNCIHNFLPVPNILYTPTEYCQPALSMYDTITQFMVTLSHTLASNLEKSLVSV
jgi:hypothetical protein